MSRKDELKIKLLSMLSLTLMIIILSMISFRLFRAIVSMFIYFTGLVTVFAFSIFFIAVIIFVICRILKNITFFKRGDINYEELLDSIINFERRIAYILFLLSLILVLIYFIV